MTPAVSPSEIEVYYSVVINNQIDNTTVSVPNGSVFLDVMEQAQKENATRFRYVCTQPKVKLFSDFERLSKNTYAPEQSIFETRLHQYFAGHLHLMAGVKKKGDTCHLLAHSRY